ncbi:MAG: ADP-ribosylglycohydrolase family protein [bacterium]|nr:ADP-ribosylglycohydrolase family protein [bacterium]
MTTDTDLRKATGMIYGLAIGDALGYPNEFISLSRIKHIHGNLGRQDLPESALYSDDTQMTLCVAEALIEEGTGSLDRIMEEVKTQFIDWYLHAEDRAPGNTCLGGVKNMIDGMHWKESGLARPGCGSAMRVSPVGYLYQHDEKKLIEAASATGICTHNNPRADAAAIGAAFAVKLALDGENPDNFIPLLKDAMGGISPEADACMQRLERCLAWKDEEEALKFLGEGWVGDEALVLSLYCFLKYPDDYKACVLRGANTNGDSDSIACIGGSISGAYLGIDAIPPAWIERIENSSLLKDIALKLYQVKRTVVEYQSTRLFL